MSLYQKALFTGIGKIFTLPRLSIPLILTLGLTLGALLSVLAITNTLIFKPMQGVKNANSLKIIQYGLSVSIDMRIPFFDSIRLAQLNKDYAQIGDWAAITASTTQAKINDNHYKITRYNASSNILQVLGTRLIQGQDVTTANENNIWISSSFAEKMGKKDTDIIGKTITIENKDYIIVGIIEDLLAVKARSKILPTQVWLIDNLKKAASITEQGEIGGSYTELILNPHQQQETHLKQNITEWVDNYMKTKFPEDKLKIFQSFAQSMPSKIVEKTYRDNLLGNTKTLLIILLIAVVGLLIMATLNLLNLFIVHYQTRKKEFALQISLGSTLNKLRSLIFLENLPSFILSSITGLLISAWLIKALPYISNSKLPLLENIVIDNTSLFFTLVIPLGLNFIFSALALYSVNKEVIAVNLSGSGKGSATQSNHLLSKSLMVLQLALASILLTGSVMLALQSYHAVYQDMGYHLGNSYEIQINGRDKSWQQKVNKDITYQGSELQSIHQQLTKTVETQITNSKVIINSFGPLANIFMTRSFINNDHPQPVIFQERYLSEDYFKAFKIPFIAGSNLSTEQIKSNDNSVVIDQTMAKVMFPKLSYSEIIGKEIGISEIPSKVNGIVKNTIFTAGDTSPIVLPSVYVADIRQHTFITLTVILPDGKNLSASMIAPTIKKAFPQLGDVKVTSLQARKLEQTLSERISLWIIITITVLTLFLAAIGISGLTQMTTNQRQYELAIRMATGASQSRLVNFILKDTLWMLFIGLGLGFIAAVWLYQQVKTQLTILPNFSWQASTILDISLVIIVLLSVLIPAWRVIRADPMQALREE